MFPRYFSRIIDEVRLSNVAYDVTTFDLTQAPSVVPSETVGLWHFDEGSGSTAFDSAGTNDGTIYGATYVGVGPTWTTGVFDGDLDFDGIDDYIEVSDSASLDITDELTIEMWIKPDSTQNTYADLLDKEHSLASSDSAWVVQQWGSTDNKYCFAWYDSGTWYGWADAKGYQLTADVFQHFVIVFDSGNVKMYHDGALVLEYTEASTSLNTNDDPLTISTNTEGLIRYFNGIMDEVRIWNQALSAEEVKKHAWGLVGEWDFNEGSGTTAYDSSGFGNDGILLPTSSEPAWVEGRLDGVTDYALNFDGVNDYVKISHSASLDLTTQITVEAWIKLDVVGGTIIRKGAYPITDPAPTWGFDIQGGKLRAFIYDEDTAYIAAGSTTLVASNWYHVAFTYDGSDVRLYLNGVEDGSQSHSGDIDSSDSPVWISRKDGNDYFEGIIDEVHIWNQALIPIKFDQTGLDDSAVGTVVTVSDPIDLEFDDLPYIMMVQSGTEVTYTYQDPVGSFTLDDVTVNGVPDGASDTIPVTIPTMAIGNYVPMDNEGPITSNVEASPNPASLTESVTLTATVDDSSTGSSNIKSAE